MIPHPLCFARWLWRSLRCGAWVEGHDFMEIREPTPPNVHVMRCEVCEEITVAWDWEPIERCQPGEHPQVVRIDPSDDGF